MKKKAFDRVANPLHCYKCGNTKLNVSDDVVKRRRSRRGENPKTFDMAAVNCPNCGHQWYSMHKDAVARSHKKDVNIARRHKNNPVNQPGQPPVVR
jgi:uncharacterized Zn finger protein